MRRLLQGDHQGKRRRAWRNISEQEVEAVLSRPDRVEHAERRRINAFKRVGLDISRSRRKGTLHELLMISADILRGAENRVHSRTTSPAPSPCTKRGGTLLYTLSNKSD